jgi:hypothetical protein
MPFHVPRGTFRWYISRLVPLGHPRAQISRLPARDRRSPNAFLAAAQHCRGGVAGGCEASGHEGGPKGTFGFAGRPNTPTNFWQLLRCPMYLVIVKDRDTGYSFRRSVREVRRAPT